MSQTYAATETYSIADIETVMRRVTADFVMIAASTKAITEEKARSWAHDVELLSRNGYLKGVDLTLFSSSVEVKATSFTVNTESGNLSTSRPGGVMWPSVPYPYLRIVLIYSAAYDDKAREKMQSKLLENWVPSNVDTGHATLTASATRDYVSHGYGMQRKDFTS
jgi:hypothetical protein